MCWNWTSLILTRSKQAQILELIIYENKFKKGEKPTHLWVSHLQGMSSLVGKDIELDAVGCHFEPHLTAR